MKFLIRNINIIIFLICLVIFAFYKNNINISTDFLSLLPNDTQKEKLQIYNDFKNSKELFVAVKGLDNDSFRQIKAIEKQILSHGAFILKTSSQTNENLREYRDKYRFFINELDLNKINSDETLPKLQFMYEQISGADFFYTIDTYDPLGLFSTKQEYKEQIKTKNAHLIIEDYGYVSIFTIDSSFDNLSKYQELYDYLDSNLSSLENIEYFSPIFYFVENSQKIKSDVNLLVFISISILLILYLVILKNIKLLVNTLFTLGSSMLISLMVLSVLFDEISVFVMAFGIAVSTIGIDYMFHHYMHDHYQQKKPFNKSVFFGFITTILVFGVFSFVDFSLISQLSIFAFISLIVSYLHFAFLYPVIGFEKKYLSIKIPNFLKLNHKVISLVSIVVIIISSYTISFDTNFKNLDYHNTKLIASETFFKTNLNADNYMAILLESDDIDTLIQRSHYISDISKDSVSPLKELLDKRSFSLRLEQLQKVDFDTLRKNIIFDSEKIGFREDFFSKAYSNEFIDVSFQELEMKNLLSMGFDIVENGGKYFTTIFVPKEDFSLMSEIEFVYIMDAQRMFASSLLSIKGQLLICGILILVIIFGILYIACKKKFFVGASFVLLPSALILLVFINDGLSILHLFIMFMVLSLGIDYGIYIARDDMTHSATNDAIVFSLLSTFAGFGVLVFSEIGSLHIIGLVCCIGISAILMLLFTKRTI